MSEQELQEYRNRLLDAGIPREIVDRNIRELRDHKEELTGNALARGLDATAAQGEAQLQLGSAAVLTEAMLARPELRGRLQRHPILWMVVAPPVVLVVIVVLMVLILIASGTLVFVDNPAVVTPPPAWLASLLTGFRMVMMHLLTPLMALVLCRLAIQAHIANRYWVTGMVLLCLLGSSIHMSFELPEPATQTQGMIGVSIAYPVGGFDPLFLRLTANLLLGAGFAWYCLRRERKAELA